MNAFPAIILVPKSLLLYYETLFQEAVALYKLNFCSKSSKAYAACEIQTRSLHLTRGLHFGKQLVEQQSI
jgi:hypothetical protein